MQKIHNFFHLKNKSLFLRIFLLLVLFINTGQNITPAYCDNLSSEEMNNISVYENACPSIVVIDADIPDGVSSGTGCIIDPRGIILTSSHVIENATSINITLYNGKKYKGKLLATTAGKSDLALVKITPVEALPVIKLGDSTKIKVGQKVLAIGNPFGFNGTLTTGIVSRIDYNLNKIQTNAAINPGSSGGPLLNSSGEVIGISQSIYNPDNNKSNIGIGFAVPVNAARRFILAMRSHSFAHLSSAP